jgi:hypothetical protein
MPTGTEDRSCSDISWEVNTPPLIPQARDSVEIEMTPGNLGTTAADTRGAKNGVRMPGVK